MPCPNDAPPRRSRPAQRVSYLEENAAAVDIALTDADLARIDAAAPAGAAVGNRYPDMSSVHR